jgi:hypothetical protein
MFPMISAARSPHHPVGLEFQEPMRGQAIIDGRTVPVSIQVKAHIEDMDRFQADPRRPVTLSGTMTVGDRRVPVSGTLNLMEQGDAANPGHYLEYRLESLAGIEPPVRFAGTKQVKNDKGFDLAADLTTLKGNFVPPGKPLDGKAEAKHPSVEMKFNWTDPRVMLPFLRSFKATEGDHYAPEHNLEALRKFAEVYGGGIIQEWVPFLSSPLGWLAR